MHFNIKLKTHISNSGDWSSLSPEVKKKGTRYNVESPEKLTAQLSVIFNYTWPYHPSVFTWSAFHNNIIMSKKIPHHIALVNHARDSSIEDGFFQ